MPDRLPIPSPAPAEEFRLLGEAVADIHYVMALIVENGTYLLPCEAVQEMKDAWASSQIVMATLVQRLTVPDPNSTLPKLELSTGDLTGPPGRAKRSFLARLRDAFLMYWNSEPRSEEKRAKAAEAGANYLEFGATVV